MEKKKEVNKDYVANALINEIHDALLFSVHSSIGFQVLDSTTSFHTITHQEIIKNYVSTNYMN